MKTYQQNYPHIKPGQTWIWESVNYVILILAIDEKEGPLVQFLESGLTLLYQVNHIKWEAVQALPYKLLKDVE